METTNTAELAVATLLVLTKIAQSKYIRARLSLSLSHLFLCKKKKKEKRKKVRDFPPKKEHFQLIHTKDWSKEAFKNQTVILYTMSYRQPSSCLVANGRNVLPLQISSV